MSSDQPRSQAGSTTGFDTSLEYNTRLMAGDYDESKGPEGPVLPVVSFIIQGQTFGIGILEIREIINLCPICRVPYTPSFILGVINLRGTITAVLDIRKFFRLKDCREYGRDARIIVVNISGKALGIIADRISGVVNIPEASIKATPVSMDPSESRFIDGIANISGQIITLVNMLHIADCGEMLNFRNVQAEGETE